MGHISEQDLRTLASYTHRDRHDALRRMSATRVGLRCAAHHRVLAARHPNARKSHAGEPTPRGAQGLPSSDTPVAVATTGRRSAPDEGISTEPLPRRTGVAPTLMTSPITRDQAATSGYAVGDWIDHDDREMTERHARKTSLADLGKHPDLRHPAERAVDQEEIGASGARLDQLRARPHRRGKREGAVPGSWPSTDWRGLPGSRRGGSVGGHPSPMSGVRRVGAPVPCVGTIPNTTMHRTSRV